MNYTIKQGEDLLVEIGVIDSTNQPVDISTATEVLVDFIQAKVTRKIKYSLNVRTGYGVLTLKDASTIAIKLTREQSALLDPGFVSAVVLVEMPDVDLTSKRTEYQYNNYIQVSAGYMKDVEI